MNHTNWEHTVLGLLLMLAIWIALALLGLLPWKKRKRQKK